MLDLLAVSPEAHDAALDVMSEMPETIEKALADSEFSLQHAIYALFDDLEEGKEEAPVAARAMWEICVSNEIPLTDAEAQMISELSFYEEEGYWSDPKLLVVES